MKRLWLEITILFLLAFKPALAIYDPLSVTNNKIGVHVLSPDELEQAARLVNNEGKNEWGYVTVPIQAIDRDREKWTRFMKNAAKYKVIPIVRVATFVDGPLWLKPGDTDLIDFANFLNDLPWPTENRYVIIFNEVNRADEFGGIVSPEKYAEILNNAIDIFKSRSEKFFILPAGLDNAAPNNDKYMRWDIYLNRMYQHRSEIFNRIDGWTSHAYGNPDFAADPLKSGQNKADSFKYDLKFLNQFTKKKLPVFITEAGWSSQKLNEQSISNFYNYALTHIWSNDQVVAVTPFLLFADNGPFIQFSLLNKDRVPTLAYQTIQKFAVSGQPKIEDYTPKPVIAEATVSATTSPIPAVLSAQTPSPKLKIIQRLVAFIRNLFHRDLFSIKLTIGNKILYVEKAISDKAKEIGLAKYDSLTPNHGMLFRYQTKGNYKFWMKDMKFDIDIIWIADNKVIGISRGEFKDPFKVIDPPGPVDTILEVNVNSGIQVSDAIKIESK